eukprot:m.156244 g.156244  ORF g.156244 m.156244 type:complete len:213 (+) comp52929_c0_seq11:1659-2297(+)
MQQNYNECLRELLKCLEYAEVFSFPALIEAHVNTARIHRQSGRAESAALAYHSACDLADRRVKDGRQHALVALELARFHVQAENDSKAEPLLCRALQIFLDLLGGDCVACVSLQDDLTKVLLRLHRHDDAVALLKRTLKTKSSVFGKCSLEAAEGYQLLGTTLLAVNDIPAAVKSLKQSVAVFRAVLGTSAKVRKLEEMIALLDGSSRSMKL